MTTMLGAHIIERRILLVPVELCTRSFGYTQLRSACNKLCCFAPTEGNFIVFTQKLNFRRAFIYEKKILLKQPTEDLKVTTINTSHYFFLFPLPELNKFKVNKEAPSEPVRRRSCSSSRDQEEQQSKLGSLLHHCKEQNYIIILSYVGGKVEMRSTPSPNRILITISSYYLPSNFMT